MKVRVILADDHPALLAGVKHKLNAMPTLEVVGMARDSGELVRLLNTTLPDVLVTDYAMPCGEFGNGIELISGLRRNYPTLRIIVFTTLDNPAITQELDRLGVNSILNKMHDTEHLVSAIHAVHAGSSYFRPDPINHQRSAPAPRASSQKALSKREIEVLRLYISGMSINEIANSLHRTKQTISTQKISAMRKLGISRDADLFRFAFETGASMASALPEALENAFSKDDGGPAANASPSRSAS